MGLSIGDSSRRFKAKKDLGAAALPVRPWLRGCLKLY